MKIGSSAVPSLSEATYDSIRKWYPSGSDKKDDDKNALIIQDVDEKFFAAMYSFHGETLMAGGEAPRVVKEEISKKVSENNQCPYCITGHAMMYAAVMYAQSKRKPSSNSGSDDGKASGTGSASSKLTKKQKKEEEEQQLKEYTTQAVAYAELLQMAERGISKLPSPRKILKKFPLLNEKAKVEIACVVLLVGHMNRVADTLVGPSMFPSWMPNVVSNFMVNRPSLWARFMIKYMGIDKPLKEGFSNKIFEKQPSSAINKSSFEEDLPIHLEGIKNGGVGRSTSVGRLHVACELFYEEEISKHVSRRILQKIEAATSIEKKPVKIQPKAVPIFVNRVVESMYKEEREGIDGEEAKETTGGGSRLTEIEKVVAWVLLASAAAPSMVYMSDQWNTMVNELGVETSRKIVVWFSAYWSLKHIQGLYVLPDNMSMTTNNTTSNDSNDRKKKK